MNRLYLKHEKTNRYHRLIYYQKTSVNIIYKEYKSLLDTQVKTILKKQIPTYLKICQPDTFQKMENECIYIYNI